MFGMLMINVYTFETEYSVLFCAVRVRIVSNSSIANRCKYLLQYWQNYYLSALSQSNGITSPCSKKTLGHHQTSPDVHKVFVEPVT